MDQHHPMTNVFLSRTNMLGYEDERLHHCIFNAVQLTSVKFEIRFIIPLKAPSVSRDIFQPRETINKVTTRSHALDKVLHNLLHSYKLWIVDRGGTRLSVCNT